MFERFTEDARRALFFARYEASQYGSSSIELEHLVLGMLRERTDLMHRILERQRVDPERLRDQVDAEIGRSEPISTSVEIPFSKDAKRALQFAAEESDRLLHRDIGKAHLLLGILRLPASRAALILDAHGLRLDTVRQHIVELSSGTARSMTPALPPDEGGAMTAAPHRFVPSSVVHIMRSVQGPSLRTSDREWMATGFTLRRLLAELWDVPETRVELPDPSAHDSFDVVLSLPEPERRTQMVQRVRDALQDQLALAITTEPREVEVWVLTAPQGPGDALRRQPVDSGGGGIGAFTSSWSTGAPPEQPIFPLDTFSATGISVAVLCEALEFVLGTPVLDESHLKGTFDLDLSDLSSNRDAFLAQLHRQCGLVLTPARRSLEHVVGRPKA